MSDQPSPRPAHLFERQLNPRLATLLAVIEHRDGPGQLRAFGVVSGMVVLSVVAQLSHRAESRCRDGFSQLSTPAEG